MSAFHFQLIDWDALPPSVHDGERGTAIWKTMQLNGLRIRQVQYSKGYLADHWCEIGHIVYCLKGSFVSELSTGEVFLLQEGMSYVVSDGLSSHKSSTEEGAILLIIDGDFLKPSELPRSSVEKI